MKEFLSHLFTPRHTNNHRAKILHTQSLLLAVVLFFTASIVIAPIKESIPQILGAAINVGAQDLLSYTNQKRAEQGLGALQLNDQLSEAAREKAQDMFASNYWAHNSPSGATPWVFIKQSGYTYVYAGENLARGFTNSKDVVDAWMASPSHRENMLSGNYEDVGFAFAQGKLGGEDTVLVVEMFGGKTIASAPRENGISLPKSAASQTSPSGQILASVFSKPAIDANLFTKNLSVFILAVFIFTFIIDTIIVQRRRIVRAVGHNVDHIIFLGIILLFILLMSRGVIA